jgi:5-methylcytosine-specific restriction endonuclease McrA
MGHNRREVTMTAIETESTVEFYPKINRSETIADLRKRDGDNCMYPDCGDPLDLEAKDGPLETTIDHWIPQYWCKEQGWTYQQIWDIDNLKLMHKRCNAKKGDRVPDENGILPERVVKKFRYRRDKRAERPEACTACDNGHNLLHDEVCASCGSDAKRYPRWAKVPLKDCDHEIFWCIWCSIGDIQRKSSIGTAMRQADSDELGEWFSTDEPVGEGPGYTVYHAEKDEKFR